ncbi:MAG: hypothetical protein BWY89_01798 [Bacteroidetes bacterium ADurb.BinA012]|nr:MAG: hypothetical protein BWY89_01798 [Bacteroidetes bacterium ADurb.BinA012]
MKSSMGDILSRLRLTALRYIGPDDEQQVISGISPITPFTIFRWSATESALMFNQFLKAGFS